ncbi:hypothetical protein B0H16DRAFT_1480133 [Mycena metata]|uniref:Uncharacterized protein n=1 Tax=Mycena metata TaxID=1033252 RepID=A0AAD7MD24_9AGAR|nr:hypothetical protein B0H16DRAFT_1480133 [Mycena metata]
MCQLTQMKIFIFVSRHRLPIPPRTSSTRKTRSQDAKASPSTPSTIKIKVPAPGSTRRPLTPAPNPAPHGQSTSALDSTSRHSSAGLPSLSTFPKLELDDYEQPFYPGLEKYPWPSDLIFDTVELQEAAPFTMDKKTAKSFYFLLHPAIGHLVPSIRRQIQVRANSQAVETAQHQLCRSRAILSLMSTSWC